jgi:ABC-type branched-subunit amino acid transport system substrate-binding protein
MTNFELAATLRETANAVEKFHSDLFLPMLECNIPQAAGRLRAVLGADVYFSIRPPSLDFHRSNSKPTVQKWQIYVQHPKESKFYDAATLPDAVNAVIAAMKEPQESAEEVQHQLNEVGCEPAPL